MLKFAIVDDNAVLCNELEQYIQTASMSLHIESSCDVYYDGESFCRALEDGEDYHLLFLDIELVQMNGIGVGTHIREYLKNNKMQIIFISAKQDYAMELFQIRPLNFLLKPISPKTIKNCLAKYLELYPKVDYFHCKIGKITHNLAYDSIIYFESCNKIVRIHTTETIFDYYAKLSDIETSLPGSFVRIHKSFIINPKYIIRQGTDNVTMSNNSVLAISRQYQKPFRELLMSTHSEGGEELFL